MRERHRTVAGIRILTTVFFAATSIYCFVVASAFAYHQFVRPGLFGWLVWARNQYDALFLGAFSLALLSLLPDLSRASAPEASWMRRAILAFAAVWGVVALALFIDPVLALRVSEERSLLLAAAVLMPAGWLAAIDHVACWTAVRDRGLTVSSEARIAAAGVTAGLVTAIIYAGLGALAAAAAESLNGGVWLGVAASIGVHLTAFAAIAWTLSAIAAFSGWRRRGDVEYALTVGLFAVWLFCLLQQRVLPALALRGAGPTVAALLFALTIAASWSGIALRLAVTDAEARTGLDVFLRPLSMHARRRPWLLVLVLPAIAYAGVVVSSLADWGFLVQTTSVLFVWLISWASMFDVCRAAGRPSRGACIAGSLVLLAAFHGVRAAEQRAREGSPGLQWATGLVDSYGTYDASFKTLADVLATRSGTTPAFYRFLTAHTNIDESIPIAPTPIDLGPALPLGLTARPHIFLFVIDSLRPDYLSPYNAGVTFTPAIGAFASESLVFRNAFTRYGGTGLSVPAVFSGSLLPHRQYVMPFAPMNALGRLLEVAGYRFAMAPDSVVDHLRIAPPGTAAIAAGERQMTGDFCTMLNDFERTLDSGPPSPDPWFVYALPQNLHLAYVLRQPQTPDTFPGFHAPVAAQLRRLDACFGAFVKSLKARGMYDQSVIVITSDHGDSLGEDGRFGHFYAGFPEIFRIPLVIRLPPELSRQWEADPTAVSFATDIAATIQVLLGGKVEPRSRLFGVPLVHRPGTAGANRREQDFLVASSYGPVYGLLSQNGRRLYVVDTINARDYSFDLTAGGAAGSRLPTTAAERRLGQQRIAEQIAEVAAFFDVRVDP